MACNVLKSNDVPSFPKNMPSSLESRTKHFTYLHACSHTVKYVHNELLVNTEINVWNYLAQRSSLADSLYFILKNWRTC